MGKKIVKVTRTVDRETGEVTQEQEVFTTRAKGEPHFVKLYMLNIPLIKPLTGSVVKVLMGVFTEMDYHNRVTLMKVDKERIGGQVGVKMPMFNRAVGQLVKHGFLIRLSAGRYEVNPGYAARGPWSEIANRIGVLRGGAE